MVGRKINETWIGSYVERELVQIVELKVHSVSAFRLTRRVPRGGSVTAVFAVHMRIFRMVRIGFAQHAAFVFVLQ